MLVSRRSFLFAAMPLLAAPPTGFGFDEFRARRAALRKQLGTSIAVLEGRTEAEGELSRDGFFQEPNFLYLTGWREAGAAVLLTPEGDTLYLPPRRPDTDRWHGRLAAHDDPGVAAQAGFDRVAPMEQLGRDVATAAHRHPELYAIDAKWKPSADLARPIARLRMVKSAAELKKLEQAIAASEAAHLAAWAKTKPGLYEYNIASTMVATYRDGGCQRSAYPPIVGSGPNSVLLHYNVNERRMDAGEILLMDVAGEYDGYAADITRTVPVNGKFTPRQREIYELVLGAQAAAIAACKPGMRLGKKDASSLYKIAFDYFEAHGKLGKYFTHGLGHHIGLDVHDPFDPDLPLAAGHVITIEPGLYLPEEKLGVRIEDMVLVTETGCRVLTSKLPSAPAAIEAAMKRR
ncbi:MAG: Xaa-Pro peptidase family protein [Bryobacteraceae bacterium]|nr:Xaa-Pro peptidase family protein [Bryobacteraceae bacterium]